MMELAYGPVLLACAEKSAIFGLLFGLLYPVLATRLAGRAPVTTLGRRIGLGLLGGGLFGLAHLVIVCAPDGSPPRIVQSMGAALLITALAGLTMLIRTRKLARAG